MKSGKSAVTTGDYDKRTQIDLSLSQQVTPSIRVFADLVNLTNEPLRYYNGIPTRPEQ
ncbi:MAG: hypothetical protein U5K69_11840 [Balneolaceae bacterium]|nr:hypothetical protein [Balneolaceae bacterium]